MILIVTHKTDFTADYVINKLNQRRITYKRLNCEDVFKDEYSFNINQEFTYSILGANQFKSVWFRRTKLPELSGLSRADQLYILKETQSLFENVFSSISANWLSHPAAVYEAENKLHQLKTALKIGFNIPSTLITNSRKELRRFYLDCNNDVVLKPICQTRVQYDNGSAFIFTSPISDAMIADIDNYELTPCIYQKSIPKDYELRITVVGTAVFAAAVFSQADNETINDWRRKKLKFHVAEIPEELEQMCVKLVHALNLKFGAIDLIKSKSGEYVFLEINPNGQWAWIESQTGQGISDAIIELLIQ